jgi:hypothetical protein
VLVGAGVALFLGALILPWAAWNNLSDRQGSYHVNETALEMLWATGEPKDVIIALLPLKDARFPDAHSARRAVEGALGGRMPQNPQIFWDRTIRDRSEGFFAVQPTKDQPICFANAFEASGDYKYSCSVFRNKADGKLLAIAGDPQLRNVAEEVNTFTVARRAEYELVESATIRSPYWNGSRKLRDDPLTSSPIFFVTMLAILLLMIAAFLRSKITVTILTLPALACGIYPLVALRDFVADASKLNLSGIVLDPAIGTGTYVVLAGGLLAAIGGLVVWFEPARPSAHPPNQSLQQTGGA